MWRKNKFKVVKYLNMDQLEYLNSRNTLLFNCHFEGMVVPGVQWLIFNIHWTYNNKHSHDWIAKEPRFLNTLFFLVMNSESPLSIVVNRIKINAFPSALIRTLSNLAILHQIHMKLTKDYETLSQSIMVIKCWNQADLFPCYKLGSQTTGI